jgi:hypothetical protein
MKCKSCKCEFRPVQGGFKNLTEEQAGALKFLRKTRCEDCAREIALGEISESALKRTTTMHDAGGGWRNIRGTVSLGG